MPQKTVRTPENLKLIRELSAQGLNKTQIIKKLKVGKGIFRYNNVLDAFDMGRVDLAEEVATSVKKNLGGSYADRSLLVQKLRLFSPKIEVDEIKDAQTAKAALGVVIKHFLNGDIPSADVEVVRKTASTFIDAEVAVTLQTEVNTLKKILEQKGLI